MDAPFTWTTHADAASLLDHTVAECLVRCPAAALLAQRLLTETGTRLIDWIDHLRVPSTQIPAWRSVGFIGADDHLRHPGGRFPAVCSGPLALMIRTESIADCCAALGATASIVGDPGPGMRQSLLASSDYAELFAVERIGNDTLLPTSCPVQRLANAKRHRDRFAVRDRDAARGFSTARILITDAVRDLGSSNACDLFFAAERDYWQSRNAAARAQKARQDACGLGWANHDHHTYRSSRGAFTTLISLLEELGFACRERFYAGREAGWGAQVLEHPVTGIVVFADVDLSPTEVGGDFAHEPLPERDDLGTVGLWCALHGEAFLEAGLHHLEATFAFDAACAQLGALGYATMKPFTDLPHLRQCFTVGERWQVDASRLDHLVRAKKLTANQAHQFAEDGAIGSHLEILERNLGFKGFNQHGVSEIIAATDPRVQAQRA